MSDSVFLSVDELATLTGVRRHSAQIRFLREKRIRHVVNRAGHPVVARAWIDAAARPQAIPEAPNLAILRRA